MQQAHAGGLGGWDAQTARALHPVLLPYFETAMLTRQEAKQLVHTRINAQDSYCEQTVELVIIDNETIAKEYGWIFFYQTKEYLETGNIIDALVGNAPYIVNKFTGELVETGTANPIEDYIAEYETRSGYGV